MTSPDTPLDAGAAAALKDLRQLLNTLRRHVAETVEELDTRVDAMSQGSQPGTPTFARPVTVPPVRMEQLARIPEPTADLDDLVDVLVPRLVERLVPALREALRSDD